MYIKLFQDLLATRLDGGSERESYTVYGAGLRKCETRLCSTKITANVTRVTHMQHVYGNIISDFQSKSGWAVASDDDGDVLPSATKYQNFNIIKVPGNALKYSRK